MTRAMKALPIVSSDLHDPDTSYKGCSKRCSKGAQRVQVLKVHSRVLNGAQGALNSRGTQEALEEYSKATPGALKSYVLKTSHTCSSSHRRVSQTGTQRRALCAQRMAHAARNAQHMQTMQRTDQLSSHTSSAGML
jgi:hypothetical protein